MTFKNGIPFGSTKKSVRGWNNSVDRGSKKLAAEAAFLKEKRLAAQAAHKDELDDDVARAERTQDALSKLGAGKSYGEF